MIWNRTVPLADINRFTRQNMAGHLSIEITEIGDDYLAAVMPINERTTMPLGFLHGGASCVLAETVGSIASWLCLDEERFRPAGVEINASHLRGARDGLVRAVCRPLRLGRTLHVWEISLFDEAEQLLCVSRLTVAAVPINHPPGTSSSAPRS